MSSVQQRITEVPSRKDDGEMLFNNAICHDLRLMIDRLSTQLTSTLSSDQGWIRQQDLCRELNINQRTLIRWRESGLRWRRGRYRDGGRMEILIHQDALALFQQCNPTQTQRASSFSHMSLVEQDRLIFRAFRLTAAVNIGLTELCVHLAKYSGRSRETIRQLLLRYNAQNPDSPLFENHSAPLTKQDHLAILRAYRAGTSVSELTRTWKRRRPTIYLAMLLARRALLLDFDTQHIAFPTFSHPHAAQVLLRHPKELFLPGDDPHPNPALTFLPSTFTPWFSRYLPNTQAQEPVHPIHELAIRRHFMLWHCQNLANNLATLDYPPSEQVQALENWQQRAKSASGILLLIHLPIMLSLCAQHVPIHAPLQIRRNALLRLLTGALPILIQTIAHWDPRSNIPLDRDCANRLRQRFAVLSSQPLTVADQDTTQPERALLHALLLQVPEALRQELNLPDQLAQ
jgi:hypothetical protein